MLSVLLPVVDINAIGTTEHQLYLFNLVVQHLRAYALTTRTRQTLHLTDVRAPASQATARVSDSRLS